MPWIKKNLGLVLGGLVGLILLGGTAFFYFSESSRESQVNALLEEKRTEWTRLNGLNPFPDEKNIKAVKLEAERLDKLSHSLREGIRPVEVPPVTDTYSLKLLIETTISNLKKEAEAAGVNLPDRYAFTFQRLREMPQFESNGIPKLAEQVSQIAILSRVLFAAKIHSLDTFRRSPVLREEGGSADYLTKKSVTNNWVVRTPYDLSFRSFSGELAEVMRGLAALDQCIAVKTVNIEPTSLPQSGGATPPPVFMPQPGSSPPTMMDPALRQRYGLGPAGDPRGEAGGGLGGAAMDPALRQRYGLGGGSGDAQMRSRYGLGPGGPAAAPPPALLNPGTPAPPAPTGPAVVLDEKPLRIILQLDFVKPKPVVEAAKVARRPATPQDGATADGSTPPADAQPQ